MISLSSPRFRNETTAEYGYRVCFVWEGSVMIGGCELCAPGEIVAQDDNAYARYDSNSLTRGHVIVVPKRHVVSYFEMSSAE